jgi:hypothetical protein
MKVSSQLNASAALPLGHPLNKMLGGPETRSRGSEKEKSSAPSGTSQGISPHKFYKFFFF